MTTPIFHGWAPEAAIVDLDGTMIDTVGDFEVALARSLGDLGFPPVTRAFIRNTVGKGSEYLLRRSLEQVGAAVELYEKAWERYQVHYLEINGKYSDIFPGVVEGLKALKAAGLRLACITNKTTNFAKPLLEHKGLDGYFEGVFGGDAFPRRKPDPMPLVETCKFLQAPPSEVLMIGDSSNDAVAARAAGCPVVLVSYGYNHGEPIENAGADAVVDRIDAVPALFGSGLGARAQG